MNTAIRLAATLITFMAIDMTMGITVFCIPMSQPLMDRVMSNGGIPHAQMVK